MTGMRKNQAFAIAHADEGRFEGAGLRPFFEYRDLGIAGATGGAYGAHVIRAVPGMESPGTWHVHDLEVGGTVLLVDSGPAQRIVWETRVTHSFAVPYESSLACLDEIRELLTTDFVDVRMPVEYRTLAADDVWLSPAFERDTATISVHRLIEFDDRAYFHACEQVFRRYDGRPHWGKMHEFDRDDLAGTHPRWTDWWSERDIIDPTGTFLNETMRSWRP